MRGPPGAATSSARVHKCPYQGETLALKGVHVCCLPPFLLAKALWRERCLAESDGLAQWQAPGKAFGEGEVVERSPGQWLRGAEWGSQWADFAPLSFQVRPCARAAPVV